MINDIRTAAYKYSEQGWCIIPCRFRDKRPLEPGWNTKHDPTTKEEIDSWLKANQNINLGLPLGNTNNIVAIDIDGEMAQEELNKISNGELPATLEFTTPGGGCRYLYSIPPNFETQDCRKKISEDHEELRFMTQGRQTILPPSVHPNGGIYQWVPGKDPESIAIAAAPDWLLGLIKKRTKPFSVYPGTDTKYSIGNLDNIYASCTWFKHCIDDPLDLSYQEWFSALTIINTCENSAEKATEFSKRYSSYSENEALEKLAYIQEKGYNPVSCSCIKSRHGEHCNGCSLGVGTPATLGRSKTQEELEAVGFYFEDGEFKGLNGNKFASYLNSRLEILYTDAGRFWIYNENRWNYADENSLSRTSRDILHEYVPNFWTLNVEASYFAALRREVKRIPELDSDRSKINLLNGIYDIKTGYLIEHTPLIRSSIQLPINYNKDAECPKFKQFLGDIFEGDNEITTLTQETFGYCLTEETSAQKAFMFYGRGSNGKSLLAEILVNLVGKANTSAVPLSDLDNSFARFELVDKLLNLATENEISDGGLNTTFFKSIVAGDPIRVEKKFEQGFMYQPKCKLVFCLNNMPYSKDKSWGFQRRIILIPFKKVFTEEDPMTKNYDELLQALLSELDGIFSWALEGLERLRQNKFRFSKSEAVDAALEDYKTEVNPYYNFTKDKLEQGSDDESISNESLSNSFKEWAAKNGHKNLASASNQKITREIRHVLLDMKVDIKFGDKVKVYGKRCTMNVRLKRSQPLTAEEVA